MDSNISDLLGGVLANPEMMSKVMTLLPAVTQMMNNSGGTSNSSEKTMTTESAAQQTNYINPQNPTEQNNPDGAENNSDNIMSDKNVAAALKNLIDALNSANRAHTDAVPVFAQQHSLSESEPQSPHSEEDAAPLSGNSNSLQSALQSMLSGGAAKPPPPAPQEDSGNVAPVSGGSINIEKTLDTLKNFSAAANPENDHRAKLLLSLKPFLKESRQGKIDTAIKYINAAKIISMFGKNGFV